MQLKNSMLLLTALTAGSAVARVHGHERRHAAAHRSHEEKRAVGDIVTAVIDGKVVSWVNEYAGGVAATATVAADVVDVTATANVQVAAAVTGSATISSSDDTPTSTPVSSADGTCSNWDDLSDDYSRDGFGGVTEPNFREYIWYRGNVGSPWGSNIIEVSEDKACRYKNVVRFEGPQSDSWTLVFWNKFGPDDQLTGWYGNSALKLNIKAGETKYVAFDDDTQGAFGAAKGDSLPTDQYGGYSSTWGEVDFANKNNNDWSGWDVSAIQVLHANQEVQGMKICDNKKSDCSYITNGFKKNYQAYDLSNEGADGIGGEEVAGPIRLIVNIDYDE
ncbi:hypothetical protein BJY04DRAFT_195887 [Aspergillus karnatakaensis]|uniref:allergen Asp F4 n=1 Tax=Aspergillus karnatakaensis TaxID=1810916 RepID=UPI003CCD3765